MSEVITKIEAAIKLLNEAIRLLDIAYVDHCATAGRLAAGGDA